MVCFRVYKFYRVYQVAWFGVYGCYVTQEGRDWFRSVRVYDPGDTAVRVLWGVRRITIIFEGIL